MSVAASGATGLLLAGAGAGYAGEHPPDGGRPLPGQEFTFSLGGYLDFLVYGHLRGSGGRPVSAAGKDRILRSLAGPAVVSRPARWRLSYLPCCSRPWLRRRVLARNERTALTHFE